MPYDRTVFFNTVRSSLFAGNLTQGQVDGMNYLLDVWEKFFETPNPRDGTNWLSYCFATAFHETGKKMTPVKENNGKPYGNPQGKYWTATGPYKQTYYGRGHVQLTWDTNYQKGQDQLKANYGLNVPIYQKADLMLQDEASALVMYDGMTIGWFTGVGLPKYFNGTTEDPVNARRIVNGTDQASTIAGYYQKFKPALVKTTTPVPTPTPEPPVVAIPNVTVTIESDQPINVTLSLGSNVTVV